MNIREKVRMHRKWSNIKSGKMGDYKINTNVALARDIIPAHPCACPRSSTAKS